MERLSHYNALHATFGDSDLCQNQAGKALWSNIRVTFSGAITWATAEKSLQDIIRCPLLTDAQQQIPLHQIGQIAPDRLCTDIGCECLVVAVGDAPVCLNKGQCLLLPFGEGRLSEQNRDRYGGLCGQYNSRGHK